MKGEVMTTNYYNKNTFLERYTIASVIFINLIAAMLSIGTICIAYLSNSFENRALIAAISILPLTGMVYLSKMISDKILSILFKKEAMRSFLELKVGLNKYKAISSEKSYRYSVSPEDIKEIVEHLTILCDLMEKYPSTVVLKRQFFDWMKYHTNRMRENNSHISIVGSQCCALFDIKEVIEEFEDGRNMIYNKYELESKKNVKESDESKKNEFMVQNKNILKSPFIFSLSLDFIIYTALNFVFHSELGLFINIALCFTIGNILVSIYNPALNMVLQAKYHEKERLEMKSFLSQKG